jgi:hypothetical protein
VSWLVLWSLLLGPGDPRLMRTIVEVPQGQAECEKLAERVGLAGRHEGNLVVELQCMRERPPGLKPRGLDT